MGGVRAYVASGGDVNRLWKGKQSALHLAAARDLFDATAALLEAPGVDVNVRGKNNDTALHIAARHAGLRVVRALLAAGTGPGCVLSLAVGQFKLMAVSDG